MLNSAFDLGEEISLRTLPYIVHDKLWNRFNNGGIDLSFANWKSIKYLDDKGENFDPDINTIPNDKGGIYLFYIKCWIISGITEYPLYIGRAQSTDNQNLRKRVKQYFQKYSNSNERPKITKMLKYWGSSIHVAYFTIDDNSDTIIIEKEIINSLLFPMNDQIPDQEIREAKKAF